MQILIISGFLGAGKTTFIQAMAKATGRQFCIVENEFGEIGIDGPLLNKSNANPDLQETTKKTEENVKIGTLDDLNVFELTEGCICCNPNIDFGSSILTIANTINPDYLIVEPSGVAFLSRILNQIRPFCYEHIGLLAPITLIDGQHYKESQKDFSDYFKNQIEHAGTLLVTKSENFLAEDFHEIKQFLAKKAIKLADDIFFPDEHYGKFSTEKWFSFLNTELIWQKDETEKNTTSRKFSFLKKEAKREETMQSVGLTDISLRSIDELITVLTILISGVCGQVVRGKGYLQFLDETIRFDIVEGTYSITIYDSMPDERGIVIGKNLNRQAITNLFKLGKLKLPLEQNV